MAGSDGNKPDQPLDGAGENARDLASAGAQENTVDTARIAAAVSEILAAINEDPSRPGLIDTPRRVAEAYSEFFSGVGVDPAALLAETVAIEPAPVSGRGNADAAPSRLGDLVLLRDIDFRSICEHHLLPFTGRCHIAYVPNERLAGLGRLPLVVDTLASRPQLQERLTEEIADVLDATLRPAGILVVMDAVHQCVTARGARQARSSTVTVASRGSLSTGREQAVVLGIMTMPAPEEDVR